MATDAPTRSREARANVKQMVAIGARYGFEHAKDAYAHAWGPDSFAKTVIELV